MGGVMGEQSSHVPALRKRGRPTADERLGIGSGGTLLEAADEQHVPVELAELPVLVTGRVLGGLALDGRARRARRAFCGRCLRR